MTDQIKNRSIRKLQSDITTLSLKLTAYITSPVYMRRIKRSDDSTNKKLVNATTFIHQGCQMKFCEKEKIFFSTAVDTLKVNKFEKKTI